MKTGVSISATQGIVDWKQVKEESIDYVMLCCGFSKGDQIEQDAYFQTNAEACMKYQIPFGTYLNCGAVNREQGEAEAEFTIAILKPYLPEYPVVLCLGDCDTTLMLKKEIMGDIAQAYCEGIMRAGYVPGVCANKYWFSNLLTDKRFENWSRWVIQHHKECTFAGTYDMWQYTSDARIQGIHGSVQISECYRCPADWKKQVQEGKMVCSNSVLPDLTGYIGVSLVGALNSRRYPSDFVYRAGLAVKTKLVSRLEDYKGTAEQNLKLLRILGGTVSSSKMLREGTYIKIKVGSRNINTGMPFGEEVYSNTYQVFSISGVSVIFGIRDIVIGKVNRNSVFVV